MKKIIVILITMSVMCGFNAYAADRVNRVHTFELDDFDEVEINNSVASIDLRLVEGNELRVEVDIEGQERFLRRDVDVDDVDVDVRMRGDKLILTINDEDVKADWYIEMPAVSDIEIDMGVGKINVEIGASNLEIDLGVGEIDIDAPLATVGEIEISAGVGDTTIRGISSVDESRVMISSESEAYGDGELSIDAEVGVGDITVRLN